MLVFSVTEFFKYIDLPNILCIILNHLTSILAYISCLTINYSMYILAFFLLMVFPYFCKVLFKFSFFCTSYFSKKPKIDIKFSFGYSFFFKLSCFIAIIRFIFYTLSYYQVQLIFFIVIPLLKRYLELKQKFKL